MESKKINNCKIKTYVLLVFSFFTLLSFSQSISPLLYGINAWMPHQYGTNAVWGKMDQLWGKVKDCHVGFVRIGGIVPDSDKPTNAQYISMIDSIRKIGAEPLVQVSYANGVYNETQAADLVKYINVDMARNVKYWSIANEPDGQYGISTSTPIAVYFKKYATAMKKIDPTIKIVGPDLSYLQFHIYHSLIGGADDITGKDANGNYILDVIAFHSYNYAGEQTRSQVINEAVTAFQEKADSIQMWINKSNLKNARTGTNILSWAVTEFNIDYQNPTVNNAEGVGAHSFINGQHWAECLGICMKNNALSFMPWSVHESNGDRSLYDLGFLDGLNGNNPRSSYYHLQMMALYNKTNYAISTSNQARVKVVSTKDASGTTVMILNEELSASFNYTIRLDNATITNGSALKINIDKGQTVQYNSTSAIPAQSTRVLVFDSSGVLTNILEYALSDAQNQTAPRGIYSSGLTTDYEGAKMISCIIQDQTSLKFDFTEMNAKADFNMQIFDMGAKLIYSKQIPYACSVVSVEKSIFGKGLFIVSIQTMNKNFYQKLTIIK